MGMKMDGNGNRREGKNGNGNAVLKWKWVEMGMGIIQCEWEKWEQESHSRTPLSHSDQIVQQMLKQWHVFYFDVITIRLLTGSCISTRHGYSETRKQSI